MARTVLACTLCLAYALAAAGQSTSSSAARAVSSTTAPLGAISIISGTAAPSATQTVTGLLSVPSYTFASSLPASATQALASSLPGFVYNLTAEALSTRTAICTQQTQYCATAGCQDSTANVTTNFCNPQTMGYNCKCSSGDSRLFAWIAPVNTFDCRLRASRCSTECLNPSATPAVTNVGQCQTACNVLIGQTCGQSSQTIIDYQVNDPSQTPSYAGNTSSGGAVTRSAAVTLGVATLLSIVAGVLVVFQHTAA